MGMRRKDLMDLTLWELLAAREGFEELESERIIEGRAMSRLIAFYAAHNPKIRSFKQILLLPGEHVTERSPEALKKRNEEHAKRAREYFERLNAN
jgi:hypothetical protein